MLILWLPCCHNFQYQIHDGYNPTWKYFRLLQCHELQTPSAEHQGTHNICTSRNATRFLKSRSPTKLPSSITYHNTHSNSGADGLHQLHRRSDRPPTTSGDRQGCRPKQSKHDFHRAGKDYFWSTWEDDEELKCVLATLFLHAPNNPNMIFIEQVKITFGQHERMMRNWCIF